MPLSLDIYISFSLEKTFKEKAPHVYFSFYREIKIAQTLISHYINVQSKKVFFLVLFRYLFLSDELILTFDFFFFL